VVAEKMAIKGAKHPRRKNEWRRQGKEMSRNGRAKGAREEQRVATQAVGTLEGRGESDPSQMAGMITVLSLPPSRHTVVRSHGIRNRCSKAFQPYCIDLSYCNAIRHSSSPPGGDPVEGRPTPCARRTCERAPMDSSRAALPAESPAQPGRTRMLSGSSSARRDA
jgi:hypothetical protein